MRAELKNQLKDLFNEQFYEDFFHKLNESHIDDLIEVLKRVRRRDGFVFSPEFKEQLDSVIPRVNLEDEIDEEAIETVLASFKSYDIKNFLDESGRIVGELPGDGNVFDHSLYQAELIKNYGAFDKEAGLIDDTELLKLKVLGLIHDIGELVVGDILYDEKNDESEDLERKFGDSLLYRIFDQEKLTTQEKNQLHQIYSINFEDSHKLKNFFKIYEKFSYMYGAICALYNSEYVRNAGLLIQNVLKNQIKPLYQRIEDYESIRNFLFDYKDVISSLFEYVDNNGVVEYMEGVKPEDNAAYLEARKIWEEYLSN